MKTWVADLPKEVQGVFFGNLNASRTISECVNNRLILMKKMDNFDLVTPLQWHSADCMVVDSLPDVVPEGDALVTSTPGLAIGVVTADCAPVLFSGVMSDGQPVVGAAHAGARGALKGVLASTVAAMRTLGARNIRAAIGPCIHQQSYEVGPDFRAEFISTDPGTIPFFKPSGDKYLFDLPGYVGALLDREAVPHSSIDVDTYTDEAHCFSYRRATHRGEADYGRQLSAIRILAV